MLANLLQVDGITGPQRSFFYLLQGRARQFNGDRTGALDALLASREAAPSVRTSGTASLLAASMILEDATEPEQVSETSTLLLDAQRLTIDDLRERSTEMLEAVQMFTSLMAAYDSRGDEAAEALLRAAEMADIYLDAAAVARGLYLEYLEVVPDSKWAAKAMFGALSLSGHQAGRRVDDQGERTDEELRRRLRDLPENDPYRAAVLGQVFADSTGPTSDSLYVLAEADLQDRLLQIQGLFDPSVFLTGQDSVPGTDLGADSAQVFREEIN